MAEKNILTHSFTLKCDGITNIIMFDILITGLNDNTKSFKTKGIWDTGATKSVITQQVVDYLGLPEAGVTFINTASASNIQRPTYLVDLVLKSDVRVHVEVTSGTILNENGVDCLIGMDVIALGDFSITQYNGKTCMSFRIPSQHEIDFTKPVKKVGARLTPPKIKRK